LKWNIPLTTAQSAAKPSTHLWRLFFDSLVVGIYRDLRHGCVEALQVIMGIAALEKRVRALERALSAAGRQCNCRTGEQTTYHSAEELKNLMDARCPTHGFRDLGHLGQLASGLPLQPDDQNLCSCPPCPVREFLQGRRGPLTEAEQEEEQQRWEREIGPGSNEGFARDQARVEELLRKYEYKKRNRGRDHGENTV
jgi:hypothetical protein